MASEGATREQPPPLQTLGTAVLGSVDTKCEFNMDNLSKPELLTLLSIMEGELEARDLFIVALKAQRKEVFPQDRYGHHSLTDPFMALQRDFECGPPGGDNERRPLGSSPISVLEAVMGHCRKMQKRMSAQLAAAESRQKRLEMEKLLLQSLEQEHRKLSAQLKDEREENKHIVMMLVRECKQLATRVVEESQRFDELQARLNEEGRSSGRLQEELGVERKRGQQMEAKMEKQLSEFDTEREQLRARLGHDKAERQSLRQQVEQLMTERPDGKDGALTAAQPAAAAEPSAPPTSPAPKPQIVTSLSIAMEPISSRTASSQTDLPPAEVEGPKKNRLAVPVKPTATNYVGLSLPKTGGRGIVHSNSGGLVQTESGTEGQATHGLPTGVSPRVQAARYKFQEQDQNGTASQTPPARDLSPTPTNRENFAAKQQARHTVTQVLSRFTCPPAGGGGVLRLGLPHSTSEGGPFPGRLSHPISIKSPTVARIGRGNPPPIPPKKPGLSQTPSPSHPPMKGLGNSGRSVGGGLRPATPQLPPKPAMDLVPALTASQVGACPHSRSGQGPQRQLEAACAESPPVIRPATIVSSPSSINPPSTSSSISAPSSRSPRASAGSPLATASGWCPSVVSSLSGGGPAALDGGRSLLPQAASQGNVTLLLMLLNQPDPTTTTNNPTHLDQDPHLYHDQISALLAAAQNRHAECVKLLLSWESPGNRFTSLHLAAAHGHSSRKCIF
ncbi:cortactin-binding protein 2-like isoform X2 [Gasterosteus aculeatus]